MKSSCKILKKRIKSARTPKKRGKALANYNKNCTKTGKKRKNVLGKKTSYKRRSRKGKKRGRKRKSRR